jgi:4'-phosphopantetheinyl transferase
MHSMLTLAPGEIHLWLAFFGEMTDQQLLACREFLSPAETQQQQRFYFDRDRRRFLVTRAAVRTILSRYASIDPRAWVFSSNAYGRPEIANTELQDERLSFNVSHTQGLIVLGVTRDCALGVDVEDLSRDVSIDIADRFFSREEVAALALVPEHRRKDRFFQYWTLKEAYIKARGMGLSIPLDQFSFSYPRDGAIDLTMDPDLGDDPSRWQFWQFRPSGQHLIAVCAERAAARPRDLTIRKVVPTAYEELLTLASCGQSSAASSR